MWTTIGTIVGGIFAPLLSFFLARYISNLVKAAQTEARQKQEEQDNRNANQKLADRDRTINDSIDDQKKAREAWKNTQGPKQP